MNLTRNNWSGGWNPSNDEINGDPKQPVQMENLCLDKDGAITLVKGTKKASSDYPDYPIALYSTTYQGRKIRYTALNNGQLYRRDTNNSYDDHIATIGPGSCAFGTGWGETLICSPNRQNYKDNMVELRKLGIPTPTSYPAITRYEQQSIEIHGGYENWTCEEGTNVIQGNYIGADSAADTNRVVLRSGDIDIDTTAFTEGRSDVMEDDTFSMSVRISDSQLLDWIRIEFWLEDPATGSNYFYTEWQNDENTPLNQGINTWSSIKCRRGDFKREGTNSDLWWYNIKKIRVVYQGNAALSAVVTDVKFSGGPKGKLTGVYQYCAVFVYNSGTYVGISPKGPTSDPCVITNGHFDIQPPNFPYYAASGCEIWIFRRSTYTEEYAQFPLGLLDKWYRVLVFTQDEQFATKSDDMDDETALKQPTLNEYLMSLQDVPEDIIGILAPVYDRTLYLTPYSIHISDSLNPDSIDTRYSITIGGNIGEQNLFIVKLAEGTVLVGTTRDFYLITGDFTSLADGTINISIKSIGEAHPPICRSFAAEAGTVFYMASDGWRSTNGSFSQLISAALNPIFNGETAYEMPPVAIIPDNQGMYACAIANSRIFTTVPLKDGRRMTFIYHLTKQYWYVMLTDPIIFYTEEDGTLLAGYSWWELGGYSGGPCIREFYTGTLLDEVGGQDIVFRTIYDDNGQPRNRKETFTFKVTADTGNKPVQLYIAKDGETFTYLGSYSFNGVEEQIIDIAETIGIGFRFAIMIHGTDLEIFRLINFTIEYSPFPEQLTSYRIPYTNLGTPSRKRIVNFPIVIETLGNPVTFTPHIDGNVGTPSTFTLSRKGTHIHYFTEETIGIDLGGYLSGGPFEFYGIDTDEITSEKLPNPTKYLVIPPNDYGKPNRKRHSSYKFQINTKGKLVRFTPIIDGVVGTPMDFSTPNKKTIQYYFTEDTIGIDIGGILQTLEDTEFEFYGVIVPQTIEVLPDMLKEFWIPESNFGIAAPKRIRTLPLVINTRGYPVTFTPYIDNTPGTPTTLITPTKQTGFHYFATDVFGTDFAGELKGTEYFEFYEMLKPESVEILPVAKRFDQIGPFRFDSIGKLLAFRLRIIPTADEYLTVKVYNNTGNSYPLNTPTYYTVPAFPVVGGRDDVYEIELPKTILGTVFRFEIGPTVAPFHRYDLQVRVNLSGQTQQGGWISLENNS